VGLEIYCKGGDRTGVYRFDYIFGLALIF